VGFIEAIVLDSLGKIQRLGHLNLVNENDLETHDKRAVFITHPEQDKQGL
jgi:hypothetical protein